MHSVRNSACLLGLLCAGIAGGAVMVQDVTSGSVETPPGADRNAVELNDGEIHLYRDANFEDEHFTIDDIMAAQQAGLPHHLAGEGLNNRISSMRWKLPKGVLVVGYDEGAGPSGQQLVLWGEGQIGELSQWDFNDKLSRVQWAYVGGQENPSQSIAASRAAPMGASTELTQDLKEGLLETYKSTDFRSDTHAIEIAGQPAGKLHPFHESMGHSVSALRWNLPDGIVVVLYEDEKPTSNQRVIWGKGELARLGDWDYNDKARRWAWYYIGDVPEE